MIELVLPAIAWAVAFTVLWWLERRERIRYQEKYDAAVAGHARFLVELATKAPRMRIEGTETGRMAPPPQPTAGQETVEAILQPEAVAARREAEAATLVRAKSKLAGLYQAQGRPVPPDDQLTKEASDLVQAYRGMDIG